MPDPATTHIPPPARNIDHPALPALRKRFAHLSLGVREFREMVTIVLPPAGLRQVCTFLRDEPTLRYDMLCDLSAVDYLNYPGGVAGRFGVNYGLTSLAHNSRLWLKIFLTPQLATAPHQSEYRDEEALEKGDPGLMIDSVTGIWAGAEWMEREVYDMFGIVFRGHPDLRRILTWNGFGSRPLRKDYPLRGVGEREDYTIVTRETA